jgi:hypothetical protein
MNSHMSGCAKWRRVIVSAAALCSLLMVSSFSADMSRDWGICPVAEASSVWVTSTVSDFNAPGSYFWNCSVNSTGEGAELRLDSGWGWKDISPKVSPGGRHSHGMAPIGNTSYILLFGGDDNINYLNDTWVFDFTTRCWTQKHPAHSPPARGLFSFAGISDDDRVVMFGGINDSPSIMNDTWIYDYSDNEWYNRTTDIAPPARRNAAMSGIERTDKVVLFGGNDRSKNLDDTWVYDVGDNIWIRMSPIIKPPARCGHSMASFGSNASVLLFGGLGPDWYLRKDTWSYDFAADQWHNRTVPWSPSERYDFAMATFYDTNEIVIFGGDMELPTVWIYNVSSGTWALNTTHNLPEIRHGPGLGTVRISHQVILFGGAIESFTCRPDTLTLDSTIYKENGVYISNIYDIGGKSDLTRIAWNASVPNGTKIGIQLRTGNSALNISYAEFSGPDGNTTSMYPSIAPIYSSHPGDSLVQYKAILVSNNNQTLSPDLNEVRIEYSVFPEAPIPLAPSQEIWLNASRPLFGWKYKDVDDSVQDGFEWELYHTDNQTYPILASGSMNTSLTSYTPDEALVDGIWLWRVRTRDPAFCWGPFCDFQTVKVDTVPPVLSKLNVTPAGWTNGPPEVTWSAIDNTSGVESYLVLVDGCVTEMGNGNVVLENLTDGIHHVLVHAIDRAGNRAEASAKVFSDRTPPEPFVPTVIPPSWSGRDPVLSFETVDNTSGLDRFEASIDSEPFSVQTNPWALENLSEGQTNITIRAYDRAGNFRDSVVSVFLDRTTPVDMFVSAAPTGWTNATPEIQFGASDNVSDIERFMVRIGNGQFVNGTSPFVPVDLPEGAVNVTVRAIDRAGNYAEGTVTVYYDRTPPSAFMVGIEPPNWTRALPTLTFNATDNVSGVDRYEISLDGGPFKKTTSLYKFASLAEGAHNITLRAVDKAGNAAVWDGMTYIDTKAPANLTLKLKKGLRSSTDRNVTLEIRAEDATSGVEMMCFSNNGTVYSAWEPFNARKEWTVAAGDGPRIVLVKVRDKAGNEALPVSVAIEPVAVGIDDNWMAIGVGIVLIVIAIGGTVFYFKGGKRKKSF